MTVHSLNVGAYRRGSRPWRSRSRLHCRHPSAAPLATEVGSHWVSVCGPGITVVVEHQPAGRRLRRELGDVEIFGIAPAELPVALVKAAPFL